MCYVNVHVVYIPWVYCNVYLDLIKSCIIIVNLRTNTITSVMLTCPVSCHILSSWSSIWNLASASYLIYKRELGNHCFWYIFLIFSVLICFMCFMVFCNCLFLCCGLKGGEIVQMHIYISCNKTSKNLQFVYMQYK